MISVYIGNLGKYNEGIIAAEPLRLPASTEELQAVLSQIGVDGIQYEEIFIPDYDTNVAGLRGHLGESESIDELNYLAVLLDELDSGQMAKFEAALSLGEYAGSVKDLINLTQNLDCYEFYPEVKNEEDLGRFLIDECGALDVPENVKGYFDYEAYGRDTFLNTTSDFAAGGYIENNMGPFIEHYDGEVPEKYQIFAYPEDPRRSILEALKQFREAPPPERGGTAKIATHEER
ncbi:MAG: antirestriction protein ArdA [Enterocloster asparagiformis]|nr:antirestriction protein ArdA [Enterocloster asparagiformis]